MGMSVIIDGSTGMTTNAGGLVNPSTNIDGINFSCRAFVNFNGTGTVAIRASGNVTNITDNGTGDYTVNLTTAMSDANYTIVSIGGDVNQAGVGTIGLNTSTLPTTSAFRVGATNNAGSFFDNSQMLFAIFR
jgi:hypothetical protein